MNDITLRLNATGGPAVQSALMGVEQAAKNLDKEIAGTGVSVGDMRRHMEDTGATLQGTVKDFNLTGDAARQAGDAFRKAARDEKMAADDLKAAIKEEAATVKAAKDKEAAATKAAADAQAEAAEKTKESSEQTKESLDKVRNAGAALAVVGAGGLALSSHLIEVAHEGEAASAALEAMLKKRGEGGRFEEMTDWAGKLAHDAALVDDDPINNAAAGMLGFGVNANQIKDLMPGLIGQSRLYHQELGQVSEAFGRAFSSGNIKQLQRSGVTFDPAELEQFKKLKDSGADWATVQARLFEMVKKSMDHYALSMTEGLSEGEVAANRFALSMDTVQTNMGLGADEARGHIKNLALSVLDLSNTTPEFQKGAGALLEYGSEALAAGGSVLALVAQVSQLYLGLAALRTARAANAAATTADTAATTANAAATTADAVAADADAVATTADTAATDAHAIAKTADTAASDANTVAVAANAAALEADAVAAGGAATSIGVLGSVSALATTELSAASAGAIGVVTLLGVAVATVVAQGIYALGQLAGLLDKNDSLLHDVSLGFTSLMHGEKAAEAQQGEEVYQKQIQKIKVVAADMRASGKSEDEIKVFVDNATMAEEEHFTKQFKAHGDDSDYVDHSEKLGRLRQQQEAAKSIAQPPAMPFIPAALSAPVTPSSAPSSTRSGATGVSASSADNNMEGLEDEVAESKKGFDPGSAANQLRLARRAERHEREGQRVLAKIEHEQIKEQKAAERARKKAEREATKAQKLEDKDDLAVQKAIIRNDREDQIASLEDHLDSAKNDKDAARVRSLTYQIERVRAERAYDEAMAAAAQTNDGHRNALEQVARVNFMHDNRKAERAANKAGNGIENRGQSRGLDLEHMQGILALQRQGFSLSDIGTARDVESALKQAQNQAKREMSPTQALAGLRNGSAHGIEYSDSHAENESGIEYSNDESFNSRVALPKPRTRRNLDGTITIYQAAWEHQVPLSRSDRDARAY